MSNNFRSPEKGTSVSLKLVPIQGEMVKRKGKLTMDMIFRVWSQYIRMNHKAMDTVADMVGHGPLKHSLCTALEIRLVSSHQVCSSCLLAMTKALSGSPLSDIRVNIIGRSCSLDDHGPYAIPAIGGFT